MNNKLNLNESIIIDKETASKSVFCFLGEFGYEMISWIPYLLYLKKTKDVTINTISRPGSKPFYYFSDNHFEVEATLIGDTWGNPKHYLHIIQNNPDVNLIFPGIDFINTKTIIIDGVEWENKDIHTILKISNYLTPDFSDINYNLPFQIKKPFVVINNKYFRQWFQKYKAPINYFDKNELEYLFDTLFNFGYSVIYNHFIENTSSDEYFDYEFNVDKFRSKNFINLNDYYKDVSIEERNKIQLKLYNESSFVIGPQGGNLYLPAVCKKDLWILMRDGEYLDYLEFGRLYNIEVNVFYEPWHLTEALKSYLTENKHLTTTKDYYHKLHFALTGERKNENSSNNPLSATIHKNQRILNIFVKREDIQQIDCITAEILPLAGFLSNLRNDDYDIDSSRWDNIKKLANNYFKLTSIEDADFILLPMKWKAGDNISIQYANLAAKYKIKLVIFFNDDSSEEIPVPNSIIFRTSLYKTTRKYNEYALPAWSEDLLAQFCGGRIQIRSKQPIPIIGFCGFASSNGEFIRQKAINFLKEDNRVISNFIIRDKFWSGALGNQSKMKLARDEFVNNILESDYILCARGAGNFSYRLYEVLSLGRIPVFINTDCVLPYEEFIDWKRYCVWIDSAEIENITQKIIEFHNHISSEDFIDLQIACRRLWEEWLSPEGYYSNLYLYFNDSHGQRYSLDNRKNLLGYMNDNEHQQIPSKSVYLYEPEMCKVMESILKPGFVVVDVGAHHGKISAVMAKMVGKSGKVFAFEASPDNCDILRKNMLMEGHSNNVIIENFAVADKTKSEIWLFRGRNSSSYEWNIVGHDVEGNKTEHALQVPAITLDNYFNREFQLDFIKIDVEGAAAMIFDGMRRILKESRPALLIEFHDNDEWDGRLILYDAGYTLHHLDGQEINPDLTTPRVYQCLALPSEQSSINISNYVATNQNITLKDKYSILFLNTYYEAFLDNHYAKQQQLYNASYSEQITALYETCFGDCNFYSSGFIKAGWYAEDLIVNCKPLQRTWAEENNFSGTDSEVVIEQIRRRHPEVVYLQDLNLATREFLEEVRLHTDIIVGQIASPLPAQTYVKGLDIIISSFPHFVKRFRDMGITTYYQPLAFDPLVLSSIGKLNRDIDISFVGGISGVHSKGTRLLEYLASTTPIEFWGYGSASLQQNSTVLAKHHGEVWGREMFQIYARSTITINRHIDIAENYANNMRLFEATGCGALLVTDYADNLNELFDIGKEVLAYRSLEECVALINYYLAHPEEAAAIARAGQKRTLRDHTYIKRMEQTAEIFERHLLYKKEKDRFAVLDMENISCGHVNIDKSQINESMTSAWKSDKIPERQRALVQKELSEMYKGLVVTPYRVLAEIMKQYVFPGCSVLEIGCASGYYYEILEYLLNQRIKYTGVDYSKAFIDMAKSYYPGVPFQVADGAQLPFRDNEFHIAVSSGLILHTPNYQLQIAETVRVAEHFVVAHRTPVCRKRTTQYMKKLAYGVETVEIIFNETTLLTEFESYGLKLMNRIEYYSSPDKDEFGVSYIFQKR